MNKSPGKKDGNFRVTPFFVRTSNPSRLYLYALLSTPAVAPKMAFAAINSASGPIAIIEEAFATEPSLKKRVYDAIGA